MEECDEEQEIDEALLQKMNEERLDKLFAEEEKEEFKSEDSQEVKTTNKWFYEAVTSFEYGSGSTLVEVAVDAEKVYALFSDFALKEISALTKAVTSERNLKELFP